MLKFWLLNTKVCSKKLGIGPIILEILSFIYYRRTNSNVYQKWFLINLKNVSGLKYESGASTPDGSDLPMFANCISMPPIPFGGGSTVTLKPIDEEECDISDPYSVCSQVCIYVYICQIPI